jgi:hypothetical protein
MKKRYFLILTALFLLLPVLSAFALNPCEHYPGQVADHELEEVNKIPPQEGVAGSVDLRCPICHQIVDSVILPALPMPAEHPASSDAENPPAAAPAFQPDPEPAIQPEASAQQEAPAQPEAPVQPETPVQPEAPVQAEAPAQPETPAQAEAPAQSETPAQPETPVQPETPARSETPAQSETPVQPEAPAQAAGGTEAVAPAEAGSPAQATAAEPPKVQDVTANEPPQTGGAVAGSGTVGTPARSGALKNTGGQAAADTQNGVKVRTFPYRRIRMKPRPGIRAEAPGDLIWPVYGTPFQDLFSE